MKKQGNQKLSKNLQQIREEFIDAWGVLGTSWGINKTTSQILALLLISENALSVEEIMNNLHISRGNASMNLRMLIDWNLIKKVLKKGERKEYFTTDNNVWSLAKIVASERRKKEVLPLLNILHEIKNEKIESSTETKAFLKNIREIEDVVRTMDRVVLAFINSEKKWLIDSLLRLIESGKK